LVARLEEDSNTIVQTAIIRALAELQATQHAPIIAQYLKHKNHMVSEAATEALGALRNPEVIPMLDQMLDSDDSFLRLAAIQSIYQIESDDTTDYLSKAIHDDDVHVRWFAMKHFAPLATSKDVRVVTRMLFDKGKPKWEQESISDYAIKALANIDTPKSRRVLDKWSILKKRM
jgi:HEAT repeat protein